MNRIRVGHAEEMCRMIGVVLTGVQISACRFLEARGYRFCVDFGHENCIAMAANHYVNDLKLRGV